MSKHKIVSFTPRPAEKIISDLSRRTDMSNVEVEAHQQRPNEEAARKAVKEATIIKTWPGGPKMTRKILEAAKKTKLIQYKSVGYDDIDIDAATELGIPVANNPGWASTPVAEHTIMLILMVLKSVQYTYTKTIQNTWAPGEQVRFWNDMRELEGKTLGILGLGAIGKQVARLAGGFGANIIYHSRRHLSEDEEASLGVKHRTFEGLLGESDILSIHVPLTDETRGLIDIDALAQMKDGAFLVNTSRKEVVDEEAVSEALKSRKLFGFGTDFIPDFPLTGLDFVVMTPHTGGTTREAITRGNDQVMDNLSRVLEGGEPLYLVNDVRLSE